MKKHPLQYIVENNSFLESIVKKFGTPLYLYSGNRIKNNLNRLSEALNKHLPKNQIYYAVKANSNPNLISFMKSIYPNLGCDCSSPGELFVAKKTGISSDRCLYTGNYESLDDLEFALDSGCNINLDDSQSFHRLIQIQTPDKISFRVNPRFGSGRFKEITTGGEKAKFGIPKEKITNAYRLAIRHGVKSFGLHCFTGSGILDENYFTELIRAVLEISTMIESRCKIKFKYISIGGGFGIPYKETDPILNIDSVFNNIAKEFFSVYDKDSCPNFCVEPGKYLVGDAGILVTKVTGVKKSYKTFVGLDAGMETLMRPVLYGAYHRIQKVGKHQENDQTVDITGRICENTDRLAVDRLFPEVNEGDLVAILDTGAYGYSMAHQFNTRPRPAEVLLNGDKPVLIRKRETIESMFERCDI
ncbi:MAG: diaminopimelate decarboxylase [Candidatus Marinimicrobia bacterium]|nr:diaminopimelate decarboxylase [Candidatus Neomarinimicrobiota bacterium]|tara:strand:- start:23624 stop:24871 length:1248 start_codon:yes stop_codon:yes gene_type:complete